MVFLVFVYVTVGSGKLFARYSGESDRQENSRVYDLVRNVDRMMSELESMRRSLMSFQSDQSSDPVTDRTSRTFEPSTGGAIENFRFFIKNTDGSFDPSHDGVVIAHQQQGSGMQREGSSGHMSRIVATVPRLDARRVDRYTGEQDVPDVLKNSTRRLTLTLVERFSGRVGDFREENIRVSASCLFQGRPVENIDPATIGGSINIHTYKDNLGKARCDVYANRPDLEHALRNRENGNGP